MLTLHVDFANVYKKEGKVAWEYYNVEYLYVKSHIEFISTTLSSRVVVLVHVGTQL